MRSECWSGYAHWVSCLLCPANLFWRIQDGRSLSPNASLEEIDRIAAELPDALLHLARDLFCSFSETLACWNSLVRRPASLNSPMPRWISLARQVNLSTMLANETSG